MNLGAEPKKVAILGGLLAVAAITYYLNTSSDAHSLQSPRTGIKSNRFL